MKNEDLEIKKEKERIQEVRERMKIIREALKQEYVNVKDGYSINVICDNCTTCNTFKIKKGMTRDVIQKAEIKCKHCECLLYEYDRREHYPE